MPALTTTSLSLFDKKKNRLLKKYVPSFQKSEITSVFGK
jgi:hypothetical protein